MKTYFKKLSWSSVGLEHWARLGAEEAPRGQDPSLRKCATWTESPSLRPLEPASSPCLPSGAKMGLRECVWLVPLAKLWADWLKEAWLEYGCRKSAGLQQGSRVFPESCTLHLQAQGVPSLQSPSSFQGRQAIWAWAEPVHSVGAPSIFPLQVQCGHVLHPSG